ncbi:MAG: GMC family oxidoreductase [Saprospiraceae bacterium]|jgi:choline dehydrogenase-like flavoprotein|uniref:GMC family oxidoreductase n=1 Tax=Candidatus Brachybacter algidus TaxID=2982024 RepID=UPI001B3F9AAC|nr:GMC family oxidoreductase [Candidatus Brachybacter algidus]MBP7306707.1 GMC family oxidoreductase [Saprospiraceae bacterium]MBK6374896.1 GMC family oxidoreductase [Candidatus Brachybacter algidus]MBK6449275.1 GMC family oxidoreductase [Candidatus Brachybacter algidus]MBK7602244.1 GMC family oxidoreductase [Candidatus Brachybacter algidus]MBK8604717.1 GMC family oxidoreductase [Candidatus Brachybacter algidus]
MANNTYDAIVIGSGISGGWAAKELTEKGLKVLMIERGRMHEHIKDYVNASKDPWEYSHRGQRTQEMIKDYPVLKRDYPLSESVLGMWADEKENPYVEEKRFDWYRGYQLGGRSLLWGRQSYRWNKWDFEANAKEGVAVDWPIRYDDLAPWYSYVERFAGIQGSKQGLDVLPDSEFLPAIDMNIVEKDLAAKLKDHYKGNRHMFIGRSANITLPKPEQNRVNCQYRNKCWLGCPYGAYFSTQSATLPAARATNNLTLEVNKIVKRLIYDKDKKRATGVEVIDAIDNKTYEYNAKIIFVCASSFNSTWILMNSATDVWPEGLGSSSGELGHNVMDHHFRLGAGGVVDGYEEFYEYGRRPSGIYIPRYRNIYDDKRDYLRGFGYQGGAGRGRGVEVAEMLGVKYKEALCEPGQWSMGMTAFGEMLPDHSNTIKLDKNMKDKWGMPVLSMNVEIKENELKMRKDMLEDAKEMLEASGVKDVYSYDSGYAVGQGIHEMGTARMGRDPKTSVLNGNNQVWEAPNVFITDGACMTSSSCVNPSLTYMAMTARAADFAVKELKKMNL